MTLSMNEIEVLFEKASQDRGWISNSFAQIEFLLGDLIVRCRQFPEYAEHTKAISHSATKRVSKVRSILDSGGPLSPFSAEMKGLLDAFSAYQEVRNLLAHGYCEFHHTPSGDAGFYFRKFDRAKAEETGDDAALIGKTFRPVDLEYHRDQMVYLADQALQVMSKIHLHFGWTDSLPIIPPAD